MLAVYTADDLGRDGLRSFANVNKLAPRAALAVDKARYAGDPVALVVAETRAQAVDAAELVDVDYDDLPAVTDVEDALADDAPLQFEAIGSNIATFRAAHDTEADVLDDADHVTRVRMVNQRIAVAPIEGNAILVRPTDEGMEVWISTQHPHMSQDLLAKAIGVEKEHVRVVAPHVGGAFGGKAGSNSDHAAIALAARKLGRPVKWTETRSEAMLSMQGRGQVQYVELGLTNDGTITGLRMRILGECGAYAGFGGALAVGPTYIMAPGPVRRPAAALRRDRRDDQHRAGRGVPRRRPAGGRRRHRPGHRPGRAGARHPAGGDPPEEPHPQGRVPLPDADRADLRRRRLRARPPGGAADRRRRRVCARSSSGASMPARRRLLGIGLATYVEITGFGGSEFGSVQIHEDGSATVMAGTSSHGQGHATSFSMIVADTLGIPIEKISYRQSDTAIVRTGGGTGGSRSLQLGGNAVSKAADETREQALGVAARMLEANPEDIVLDDDGFGVAGVPGNRITWPELAAYAHEHDGGLGVDTDYTQDGATFPFGAHVSVVEVDVETGQVRPAATRPGRRLRADREPADRGRPAARRWHPGHQPGPLGGDAVRRVRHADHQLLRRLRDADGGRRHHARGLEHRDPDAGEPDRRQGHRRVRDDRLDARRPERRRRRAQAPRREAHRPAVHGAARLARDPEPALRCLAQPPAAFDGLRNEGDEPENIEA